MLQEMYLVIINVQKIRFNVLFANIQEMQPPAFQTNIFRPFALLWIFLLQSHGRHGISPNFHLTSKYEYICSSRLSDF